MTVLVCVLLVLGCGAPLVLERPTVGSFFLCHFTHLSLRHLAFSGAATAVMAFALERKWGSARLLGLLGACVVGISAAVIAFERGRIGDYCGASGVGYALAAALAVGLRRNLSVAVVGFLAVKVGFEFFTGRCLVDVSLEAAGAVPVPVAHATGLAIGSVLGSLLEPKVTAGARGCVPSLAA